MRQKPESLEQRQHINISRYAYEIVRNDSLNFMGKLNISGFINKIVENSMVDSFEDLVLEETERIRLELNKSSFTEDEKKIINKIAKAHKNTLIHPENKYSKDQTLKIRLNGKVYKKLYSPDWDGNKNDISQGEYIKLLVEEYARKTIFQRETVFYKEIIEKINKYANETSNDNCLLTFTISTNNKKYFFKPYRLSKEYEANYHYLIGYSRKDGKQDFQIASIRLSRINDLEPRSKSFGSGKLTKAEIKEIDKRIEDCGVPYILTGTETFVINLTEKGMNTYNNIYHQRPVYNELEYNEDGTYTMIINASEIQITNYFFQFRGEAVVLSPEKTRNIMKEWFDIALNKYI